MAEHILRSPGEGVTLKQDPYFDMVAPNLNTMNSYFIPATKNPQEIVYPQEWTAYPTYNTAFHIGSYAIPLHIMSSYVGVGFVVAMIWLTAWALVKKKMSWFSLLFTDLFEGIYHFFEELIGADKPSRITNYVTSLFFVILFSNLLGIFNDLIRFVFPRWLRNVTTPTAELEFNVALAIGTVGISLYMQARTLGIRNFLHEYVPITGKWLIEGEGIGAKIGDIVISLFVGVLDIVGTFAKIISLSMRLFGNMSSGSILLNIAFLWLGGLFVHLFGANFPFLLPIVVYLQGLLVACVQAFVFSLLSAVFIKMSLD